ncbi:Pentacotripeptide-repeat region of PRORP [Dillenia turbinata]|uniref:Pentacotripeptide-repeat region of PRORP n=1 Tax=Dillenia turbinata TaxID=194707 RepID=A0AAN8UI65_9MAGN
MVMKSLSSSKLRIFNVLSSLFSQPHFPKPPIFKPFSPRSLSSRSSSSSPQDINEICRILSDYRSQHHDIESALAPFSHKLSNDLVEQVLKRSKNLGSAAHRFFLWAQSLNGFKHSQHSFHIIVDILGSTKQFPLMWDLLHEVKFTGDIEISHGIFWVLFRVYCRMNLPTDAIKAFSKMGEFGLDPSIEDIHQLLYALCKRKHVKHAQQLFDRLKVEYDVGAKSYTILMSGLGEVGDTDEVRKLYDEMLERGYVVDVAAYNCLLDCLCRGGNVDEAYKLFREMGSIGLEPDTCSYSIFIRAYCKANDLHRAFRLFDRMRRYNLTANVFTCNCIIKRLCMNEKVEDAYNLLDEMIERNVKPDVWSYNAILAFHCEHFEVNKAQRLLSKMDKNSCLPDRHTYNMLLKMLIRIGRFDRMMELWEGMEEKGYYPSVSTYAVIIHGLCKKKGKLEEACKFFEMMIDAGIPPYTSTCQMLRNKLIGSGFSEQTEILADKMERSTSCSIQELSNMMRGNKANWRVLDEERDFVSEEDEL